MPVISDFKLSFSFLILIVLILLKCKSAGTEWNSKAQVQSICRFHRSRSIVIHKFQLLHYKQFSPIARCSSLQLNRRIQDKGQSTLHNKAPKLRVPKN